MEPLAHRKGAALFPQRGLTLSPAVDANLRDRIRSLLVSRNRQNPPKTPCPSPDSHYLRRDSEELQSSNSVDSKKSYQSSLPPEVSQRARLEDKSLDMGATRFDGPAGKIDNSGDDYPRRPSHPGVQTERKLSGEWHWSTPTTGLNQKAPGNVLGREVATPMPLNLTKSSASKSQTASRIPRFHLRTVPPAVDVNKILRPNPLHVPGSYQTEVDIKKDDLKKDLSSNVVSSTPNEMTGASDNGVLGTSFHVGLSEGHSHQAATDALKDISEHSHQQSAWAAPKLFSHPHQTNEPDTASKEPHQLPPKSSTDHNFTSSVTQTAVIFADRQEQNYSGSCEGQPLIVGSDHEEDATISDEKITRNDEAPRSEQHGFPSTPQVHELLAELPPIQQTTVVDLLNHVSTATASTDLEQHSFSKLLSSASSLHSVGLNDDKDGTSPVLPLLSRSTDFHGVPETFEDQNEETSPLVPETRRTSHANGRLSSVSRAMSMLSELTARSGVKSPSLRSLGKPKNTETTSTLTTRTSSSYKHKPRQATPTKEGYESLDDGGQQGPSERSNSNALRMDLHNNSGSEGFTKVITDLESVLQEALDIAGHAANKDHTERRQHASQTRRDQYRRIGSETSIGSSEYVSSLSGEADEEDNLTTLPLIKTRHVREDVVAAGPVKVDSRHDQSEKSSYPSQAEHASTLRGHEDEKPEPGLQRYQGSPRMPRTSSKMLSPVREPLHHQSLNSTDWAVIRVPSTPSKLRLEVKSPPPAPQMPQNVRDSAKVQHLFHVRDHGASEDTATRNSIREYVEAHQRPPIQNRLSSMRLRVRATQGRKPKPKELDLPDEKTKDDEDNDCDCIPYTADFVTSGRHYHPVCQDAANDEPSQVPRQNPRISQNQQNTLTSLRNEGSRAQETSRQDEAPPATNTYSLEGRHHFSIREPRGFSLSRSHRRSPIARDWSSSRKRFTATVVCITTAFMGLIIGIYAGEVPAIQYAIADEHHYTILGNVFFYIGLAITTALFYPLPLLHGRKPYTLAALAILLPLQFPQALAVEGSRSPYVATYRVGLLVPRIFAGIVTGFANINFITTLLDLFGASLQSGNPHQETVNENDVRRHGGGMGVWLSIWTWCAIGSLGLGFLIGAGIISGLNVSWGYWILIILNAAVLVLNILTPEVRRSAYRRSMAEVRNGGEVSRRVARGEIKMHLQSTGPIWWWEEVWWGHVLAIRMLKQPGFAVLSLYLGWIYGQVVLTIVVSQSASL